VSADLLTTGAPLPLLEVCLLTSAIGDAAISRIRVSLFDSAEVCDFELTGSESPCGGVRVVEDDCEDDSHRQTDQHSYHCERIAALQLSICRRIHRR